MIEDLPFILLCIGIFFGGAALLATIIIFPPW